MKVTLKNHKLNKFLKKISITLCIAGTTPPVCAFGYDTYLNSKLNVIEFNTDEINKISQFYQNQEITIFIMNDSQGINLNLGFWKNSYPEYLEEALNATVIDSSSLRYNKVSHIDMLLDHNVSLEELKELNNAGANLAIQALAKQLNLPEFLQNGAGQIGESILEQKILEQDKDIYISDLLKETKKPIFIYSSGANDLMFLVNANPASLKKYDSDGNISPKYIYAKEHMEDENTIEQIMNGIENNWKHILAINPSTKIIALSIYVPHSLQSEEYKDFAQAIKIYNEKLKQLCEKYNTVYINEEQLGTIYNKDDFNFHINEIGHKQLSSLLISTIYNCLECTNHIELEEYLYDTQGLEGVYNDLKNEQYKIKYPNVIDNDYLCTVYNEQVKEKEIDAEICKRLLKKPQNKN